MALKALSLDSTSKDGQHDVRKAGLHQVEGDRAWPWGVPCRVAELVHLREREWDSLLGPTTGDRSMC